MMENIPSVMARIFLDSRVSHMSRTWLYLPTFSDFEISGVHLSLGIVRIGLPAEPEIAIRDEK